MLGTLDVFSIEGRAVITLVDGERFELELSWP